MLVASTLGVASCASQAGTSSSAPAGGDPPSAGSAASVAARPRPAPPDPALVQRLRDDVEKIAIRRDPGSPGWTAVRALIEARLKEQGWDPTEDAFESGAGRGINVLARREGSDPSAGTVILSAHYDHIWDCPGADDNASGVAAVLEAARELHDDASKQSVMLAFWDHEEDGLVGSSSWARRAKLRGDKIDLAIALDGVGYTDRHPGSQSLPPASESLLPDVARTLKTNGYRADFIALIADGGSDVWADAFEKSADDRGLPAVVVSLNALTRVLLLDAARSDHAAFWVLGYRAMLVTDTANFRNPRYHCGEGQDTPDSLDYEFLARVTSTVIDTTRAAAK